MNWGSLVSMVSGFIFAIGLSLSGMTQPQKVIGFLDVFGNWDLTLMFVMVGAIAVHAIFYALIIKRRSNPYLSDKFKLPTNQSISGKLIFGAALFGVGWGLGGLCPGPALVSMVSGSWQILYFVIAMFLGMWFSMLLKYGNS